jgi:hypothetical protein
MKLIVATKETQGQCKDDFCFADEGEIVVVSDCDNLHGSCGCDRSMVGVRSTGGTTTMLVVEADITREQYIEQLRTANGDYAGCDLSDAFFAAQADVLLELAAEFPVGTVIERKGDDFEQRDIIIKNNWNLTAPSFIYSTGNR